MKTAIKLILIYFGIQILSAIAFAVPYSIYSWVKYGDFSGSTDSILAPALLLSIAMMGIYLWKSGYLNMDKRVWSVVSPVYLILAVFVCLASIVIVDFIGSLMPWLPNLMEDSFDVMQAGWLGIFTISIFGPVLEEVMFRGAITTALLKKYSPVKAIILSGLIFGIFHINPAQIVAGTLIGFLLGWVFYKTASLIPCILIHIVNNVLAVYFSLRIKYDVNFRDVESLQDVFTIWTYFIILMVAIAIFVISVLWMNRTTIAYPWKECEPEEVEPINSEELK